MKAERDKRAAILQAEGQKQAEIERQKVKSRLKSLLLKQKKKLILGEQRVLENLNYLKLKVGLRL